MPTAFCALDEAYGQWGKKIRKANAQAANQTSKKTGPNNESGNQDQNNGSGSGSGSTSLSSLNVYNGSSSNDPRSFCPNCHNCLDANNRLQQSIIEQNIWPRPRWVPQNPQAYEAHDPYNRYWMDNWSPQRRENYGRENFGMPGSLFNIERFGNLNLNNSEGLLQLILFILIALFVIQLFEMIFKLGGSN